jgi:hypothetical protein
MLWILLPTTLPLTRWENSGCLVICLVADRWRRALLTTPPGLPAPAMIRPLTLPADKAAHAEHGSKQTPAICFSFHPSLPSLPLLFLFSALPLHSHLRPLSPHSACICTAALLASPVLFVPRFGKRMCTVRPYPVSVLSEPVSTCGVGHPFGASPLFSFKTYLADISTTTLPGQRLNESWRWVTG